MTTSAELEMPAVAVSPGSTATTSLTIRNDTDIVEAYTLTVVGDCAAWSAVEPERVSLYPGTSETVTVQLAPPRSSEVRAGELPLGVRVLPAEQPDLVVVPETTVRLAPFHELRTELEPRRRRGWVGARYRVAVQNRGNTPVTVGLVGKQDGEDLRFTVRNGNPRLEPGESAESGLRVRTGKPRWFGPSVTWPFGVAVTASDAAAGEEPRSGREPLEGEFVQLSVFPKWLLGLLAALLALLLAWFALVRPAVRSTAKQAADEAAAERAAAKGGGKQGESGAPGAGGAGKGDKKAGQPGGGAPGQGTGGNGGGSGGVTGPDIVPGSGRQSSATVDVQTGGGSRKVGTYKVPEGRVLGVTDIVVANFQGDEGVVTIKFGERKITTIALETFRNQDYHWVTPIRIPEDATVTADVTCAKPGTPATGKRASGCHEVLNVSGVLGELKQ
ncbi:hydrolytic protein [Streptomyces qinglanensis]|uniref:hydrolytic protein n=1 Tax=Streptomyces qinglanensis TaxID=943816 RepID=UPI0037B437BC